MPASTNLIGDMGSVVTNGPNAATIALAIAPAGPIMDYPGNTNLMLLNFKEASNLLTAVKGVTDAGDGNLTNINAVLAALNGTGGPSSTVLTAMQAVITAGPTAATQAKAIAPAGEIMDYLGNCYGVLLKLKEVAKLIVNVITDTASGDSTNLTLLQNVQLTLA